MYEEKNGLREEGGYDGGEGREGGGGGEEDRGKGTERGSSGCGRIARVSR